MIAGGRHGIEQKLELPPPLTGNAYTSDLPRVPRSLWQARDAFSGSRVARVRLRRGRRRPLHQHGRRRTGGLRERGDRLGASSRLREDVTRVSGSTVHDRAEPGHRGGRHRSRADRRRMAPTSSSSGPTRRSGHGGRSRRGSGPACCVASPPSSRTIGRNSRRSRWPTPVTPSPVPAGRPTTSGTYCNYYAAAPERLFGRQIPVAGGIDVTFREPLGVVGVIVPWNFPMPIAALGFRPGPGRREHGGAETRGTHAADGHPAGRARRGGGSSARGLHRHPGPRLRRGPALRGASPGPQDLLHRIDRGGQGDHGGMCGAAEAVHLGAGREERQRDLRRRRSGPARRPAPRTRCSTTRARTAARGPGS